MPADLVIYGTGGLARELHQIVEDVNEVVARWRFVGFLDDDADLHGRTVHGHPVLGDHRWLATRTMTAVVIGIGSPRARARVVRSIDAAAAGSARFATLVHPRAWVGDRVTIGRGSVVAAGSLVTTDLRIGHHAVVNLGCTVGHDATIGDYATLAPSVNVSGAVRVGVGADVGTGAAIIPGVDVGDWSVVGAGTVLIRDVPPGATAVGNPGRVLDRRPAAVGA